MVSIDLNSDLGESLGRWTLGDDEAMLELVTSANVACGFHAGDPSTLRSVCQSAAARGVKIGAQVSFPDLAGFGRRHMDVEPAELQDIVLYQIGALDAFARACGTSVRYVKPHGALYHAAADDPSVGGAIVAAAVEYDAPLSVVGLAGSAFLDLARNAGLSAIPEAFADRAYHPDGRLVSRRDAQAVLTDVTAVVERVVRLAVDRHVTAHDGSTVAVEALSVCLHGDTPGAVAMARAVRTALVAAGVSVESFVV